MLLISSAKGMRIWGNETRLVHLDHADLKSVADRKFIAGNEVNPVQYLHVFDNLTKF